MVTEIRSETTDLDDARRRLLESVEGLPDSAFDQPDVIGVWSIRACFAHMIAWDRWVVHAMERWQAGEPIASLPAEHAVNDYAPKAWEHFQISELLRSLGQAREVLRGRIRSLSDAERARRDCAIGDEMWSVNDATDAMIEHDLEHAADIRAWRVTAAASELTGAEQRSASA